jgi:hypothetical protein
MVSLAMKQPVSFRHFHSRLAHALSRELQQRARRYFHCLRGCLPPTPFVLDMALALRFARLRATCLRAFHLGENSRWRLAARWLAHSRP